LHPPNEQSKLWAAGKNAAHSLMKTPNQNPEDANLDRALRSARPEPSLPPRFQEGVWRRIAEAESPMREAASASWLDALAAFVMKPRFALATAAVLILAGTLLGVREASQTARHEAQARYVAAVAPGTLR